MKLTSFTLNRTDEPRVGVLIGNDVLDLHRASKNKLSGDMLTLIQNWEDVYETVNHLVQNLDKSFLYKSSEIIFCVPISNPPSLRDFFAFEEHAKAGARRRNEELPKEWYEVPAYYKGNHRELYGPEQEIPWPYYTRKLDFECEIACVISEKGKNISIKDAEKYIFGYMIFNDFSARDIQKKEMALRMGPTKGKDFANAFGPYIVTSDEVDPQKDFSLTVKVNGEVWSSGHFKDQYWGFPLMVSYLSQEENIYPGDILGSGTFYKGCGLDLDRWIKPGDVVELEVPKLGILRNKVGHPKEQRELNFKKTMSVI